MFSPPPSPLPPRHPPLAESSSDGNDGTEEKLPAPTAEETTFQSASEGKASRLTGTIIPPRSSSPLPSFPYIRRHLLVFMIPLILFIVGSTSSFIVGHEERGNFDNTPVWRETISGSLRDPSFLPVVVAPVRHTLGQLSRHLHKARLYGGGKARSPTFPAAEPRDDDAHSGNNGIPAARQATPPTGTVANAVQETPPSIPTPAWPVPTPFPQPFDSSISYNFTTSSCLAFFTTQLANNTFRECRPFGLLFGTSSDFFSVQSNLTELTAVLGGTCNTVPSEDTCVGIMDWMASQMLLPSVCRDDLAQQNVVALEAIYGFRSYKLFRQAGCLVNPRTNAYCFAEALAQTSPSDLYYYALPLGTPVPGTTPTTTSSGDGHSTSTSTSTSPVPAPATTFAPSCSTCVQSLMAIFAPYATDPSYLLALTYPPAAKAANKQCGKGYAPGPETVVASPTPPVPRSLSSTGGALSERVVLRWRREQGKYDRLATCFVFVFPTVIFALAGTQSWIL